MTEDKSIGVDYAQLPADELLEALKYAGRTPSLELIRACLQRREELTPGLLTMLEECYDENWATDDPRMYGQVHAGLLLMHWREPAALPILGKLFRAREEISEALIEWFSIDLANYGVQAVPTLREVLYDEQATAYGRIAAGGIMSDLALQHPELREEVAHALREQLPPLTDDGTLVLPEVITDDHDFLWSSTATDLAKLGDEQSRDQIVAMYEKQVIDTMFMGDVDGYLKYLAEPPDLSRVREPADIIAVYEGLHNQAKRDAEIWARVEEQRKKDAERQARAEEESRQERQRAASRGETTWSPKAQTVVRATPKVGRNDPCPCGSGKKYKKCCGK